MRSPATLRALTAALALAASGCAHVSTPFSCPDKGGVAWRELRTRHFVLQTDLSSRKATELARELEMMHSAVSAGLFRAAPELPGVLYVVAFRSMDEFDLFAPSEGAAAYYSDGRWGRRTIVLPGVFEEAQRAVLAHEIAHHLTAFAFARKPLWFSEGVATLMETVGANGPNNTPTLGGVPKYRLASIYPYHGGVREVLEPKGAFTFRHYGLSWALVHFLLNRHAGEFGQLQVRFARGEDPIVAWKAIFPQWDPATGGAERLDREIGQYLTTGRYGYRDVHLQKEHAVHERPLSAAEAHAVRLSLPWFNRGKPSPKERRLAEVHEALEEDAGNVPALAALISELEETQRVRAPELAKRATDAHPDDVRAWLLASSYPAAPLTREAALRRAVEVAPDDAWALNNLAWELLGTERSGEALPLARRAVAAAPWDSAALDTLAGVLEDLGQCAEALATQRRAIDVLPEGMPEEGRASYRERIDRLERSCGAQRAATR